ncbi:hypothetical protein BY996DRAFT_2808024 [Phakopsora pachyrhizi]|nr:hypothetical protein BY996DRAFT_2808024 [Phakopsora pachyrhizi]
MNAHKQCSSELDNLKLEGKRSEEKKVAEIFKVRTDENSLRQKKSTTDERILELKHKIRSLTQQIENVKVSEVDIKYQADNLKERRDRLSEVRQWFIDSKVEDQIKSNQSDIKSLEYERDKAHTELMDLNRNFDTLAKVNLKRGDVKKRETGIQTLIEANSKKFKELIGVELVLENADDLISSTVHKTEILISKAEEERTRMTNDRQSLETSRTEGKTVVERIKEAEWHISEFTRDLDNIQFSVKFHETLSSKAKENKKDYTQQAKRYRTV